MGLKDLFYNSNNSLKLLTMANKAIDRGDWLNAVEIYDELIQFDDQNFGKIPQKKYEKTLSKDYVLRGNAFLHIKDEKRALQDYENGIMYDIENEDAWANKAMILSFSDDNLDEAYLAAKRALAINPRNQKALMICEKLKS